MITAPIVLNFHIGGPENPGQAVVTVEQFAAIESKLRAMPGIWDEMVRFAEFMRAPSNTTRPSQEVGTLEPVLSEMIAEYTDHVKLVFWPVLLALVEDVGEVD